MYFFYFFLFIIRIFIQGKIYTSENIYKYKSSVINVCPVVKKLKIELKSKKSKKENKSK